jgi:hypothetical protein
MKNQWINGDQSYENQSVNLWYFVILIIYYVFSIFVVRRTLKLPRHAVQYATGRARLQTLLKYV